MSPESPAEPTKPTEPTEPTEAIGPDSPTEASAPTVASAPTEADAPAEPTDPTEADGPAGPDAPTEPEVPAEPDAPVEPQPAVRLEGAGLRGGRGWVFRDVSFTAHTGTITTLTGPSGSGRSTALLACAGRLDLTTGSAVVHPPRRRVRDHVNVARIAGVIGLDPQLSVADNVNDAADWARLRRTQARDLLATWRSRLDLQLPSRLPAGELAADELTLLHLLCATLGNPRAIVLDDFDANLTIPQIARLWKLTARVAAGRVSAPSAVIVSTVAALPPAGERVIHLGDANGAAA
ncbi:ATP-binding cassette domain-containing protein [Pseudactinotalea sp. HY160]|uniref:ATP-binding cassette domain-containing protein n=1 Tax=Pseudactinotalea sp. HY160 TaxID=2654490 RepID=UPI00128B2C72|nr:ATP-binding cassette domain-containing protein [Pseudactinotalea sp. HY160]MPV50569.1 ATP-binding cassette domain-containing protein [Pseudactinotalea sp. HY160]